MFLSVEVWRCEREKEKQCNAGGKEGDTTGRKEEMASGKKKKKESQTEHKNRLARMASAFVSDASTNHIKEKQCKQHSYRLLLTSLN